MSGNTDKIDINHLNKWLGKEDLVTDYVTPIVEQRYRATLNMDPGNPELGEPVTSGYTGCWGGI